MDMGAEGGELDDCRGQRAQHCYVVWSPSSCGRKAGGEQAIMRSNHPRRKKTCHRRVGLPSGYHSQQYRPVSCILTPPISFFAASTPSSLCAGWGAAEPNPSDLLKPQTSGISNRHAARKTHTNPTPVRSRTSCAVARSYYFAQNRILFLTREAGPHEKMPEPSQAAEKMHPLPPGQKKASHSHVAPCLQKSPNSPRAKLPVYHLETIVLSTSLPYLACHLSMCRASS